MSLETLTSFFGWCTAFSVTLLLVTTLALVVMREFAVKVHSRLFCVSEEQLSVVYFTYLAQFKIAVLVFNVVPYLALRCMNH